MDENQSDPIIHTYQSDVEEAIKRDKISGTRILVAEQEKKVREYVTPPKPGIFSFNIRSVSIAILFLMVGGAGLYYFLKTPASKISPTPVISKNPEQALINYDSYVGDKLEESSRAGLLNKINTEKNKTIQGIEVVSFGITSEQFLYLLSPNIPGILVRAIDSSFAFGFIPSRDQPGANRSFLVLKVVEYPAARGSMLSEESNIIREMGDVFNIPNSLSLQFKDRVIENHDARVLVDSQNTPYFLYSFLDSNTLVFAEDDDTFKTVTDRINSAKR